MDKKQIFNKLFALVVYDEPFVSYWLKLPKLHNFIFDTYVHFILERFPKLFSWELIGDSLGCYIKQGFTDIDTFMEPIEFFEHILSWNINCPQYFDVYLLAEFLECYWCDLIEKSFNECDLLRDAENIFKVEPDYKERIAKWEGVYNDLNIEVEKYRGVGSNMKIFVK